MKNTSIKCPYCGAEMSALPIKRDDPGILRIRYSIQYQCGSCRSTSPLTVLEIDVSNRMFGRMPSDKELFEMLNTSATSYARMRAKPRVEAEE